METIGWYNQEISTAIILVVKSKVLGILSIIPDNKQKDYYTAVSTLGIRFLSHYLKQVSQVN